MLVSPAPLVIDVAELPLIVVAPSAVSAESPPQGDANQRQARSDNRPNPLAEQQNELRKAAVDALLKGEATTKTVNGKRVIEVKGKDGESVFGTIDQKVVESGAGA